MPRGSLTSPYLGISRLNVVFDPAINSIRHAGYVNFQSRLSRGLAFTANYTYGKSIDEASDAGGDLGAGPFNTSGRSQVNFGGTLRDERAVSAYDVKHSFASTVNYELPFGRGHAFLSDTPGIVDAILGSYTLNAIVRVVGGVPVQVFLGDTNRLGIGADNNSRVRPNLVPGVPVRNPLFTTSCPFPPCEPILNPAAFTRPPKGEIGNAPRTFDSVRLPTREYFDLSIHKNFRLGDEGRRSLQLRLDAINIFNHPNFNYQGGNGNVFNFPTEGEISANDYNVWARANNRPLSGTVAGDALFAQVRNFAINSRVINGVPNVNGQLPAAFFSVPVPEGFNTLQPNSFDITTLDGYKLYRLRQAFNNSFVRLQNDSASSPRYLQFGIKLYF
ncbi:MAG: hypothetical protein M3R15_23070 [Acidobacteriota bacterium]|nr:hypothetical protein [Acidobacteriota bacterium]